MLSSADIVIIGGGIAGCALLYELTRAKSGSVMLLERGQLAGETTGRSGGFIRKVNSDPALRKMMSDSFDYYLNFSRETGKSCGFINTGLIYRFRGPITDEFKSHLNDLNRQEHRITMLSSANHVMIHEHAAGCIDPAVTCRAWVNAARAHQGSVHENVAVEKVLVRNGSVTGVLTTGGVINCPRVIIAAGAWSRKLLASAGIESAISIESFQNNIYQSAAHLLGGAYLDEVNKFYLFPLRNGDAVAGLLQDGKTVIVDDFEHQVDEDEAKILHARVNRAFPRMSDKNNYKITVSHDAFTDDGIGAAMEFPGAAGLYAVTGLSAGGIKIMPALANKMVNMTRATS